MLKKIYIENYGPFKKAEVNLENNKPIHVIGLNDAGKTCLLSLMFWQINGLNPIYFVQPTTRNENLVPKIKYLYELKINFNNINFNIPLKNEEIMEFEMKTNEYGQMDFALNFNVLYSVKTTKSKIIKVFDWVNKSLPNELKFVKDTNSIFNFDKNIFDDLKKQIIRI